MSNCNKSVYVNSVKTPLTFSTPFPPKSFFTRACCIGIVEARAVVVTVASRLEALKRFYDHNYT